MTCTEHQTGSGYSHQQKLLDRLSIVEKKVTEMETALTLVDHLQREVDRTTGTVSKMAPLLDHASNRLEDLESNILQLEIYSRNVNLRFCGIPESEKENVSESPADVLEKISKFSETIFNYLM